MMTQARKKTRTEIETSASRIRVAHPYSDCRLKMYYGEKVVKGTKVLDSFNTEVKQEDWLIKVNTFRWDKMYLRRVVAVLDDCVLLWNPITGNVGRHTVISNLFVLKGDNLDDIYKKELLEFETGEVQESLP